MQVLGKTAVLVERIINKIINEGVSIDRLLVVTFTKAAASEMKERVADRLYKELPNIPSLQNQINMLSKASITTIDSFCLRVVKDNFFKLDLDPNFRIGDSGETEILKQEALEELLEEKYEEDSDSFTNLINSYASNKDDDNLIELILKIHNFTRSLVDPNAWMDEKVEYFNIENANITSKDEYLSSSIYGKAILSYAKNQIDLAISTLEELYNSISDSMLAGKYIDVISEDITNLKYLVNKCSSWNDLYSNLYNFVFARANGAKGVPEDLKATINDTREFTKEIIKNLKEKVLLNSSEEILLDFPCIYNNIKYICELVKLFDDIYSSKKREKNILDFSDEAHFALELLKDNEDIANMYRNQFDEILIDEYQDSNLIQEFILKSISKNNIFMVGDVKQSIYKFRGARPELFLEKYNSYEDVNSEATNKKVLLFKNFRSNNNIIEQANYLFEKIMSKELGDLDYTEEEFLKFGADYYESNGCNAELAMIETKNQDEDFELDESLLLDSNSNLEGRYIANRISEIVGKEDIFDKKTNSYRKAMYKDIVILLRSSVGRLDGIIEELSNKNIPLYAENSGNYFESFEVQTILSLLRIIDNPIQDIPLVSVLNSQIGGFNVNELSKIRIANRVGSFYNSLIMYLNVEDELALKVKSFLDWVHSLREKSKYMSIWELLVYILNETGYMDYISLFPDGIRRSSNLKLLLERAEKYEKSSFKGLFSFLSYIDNIKQTSSDYSESKVAAENDNVVRIMSIHKSKGLEFPIVFIAGTDKRFNTRDLSTNILLDHELGFGMDVIDYDSRIKFANISKQAISLKVLKESYSEEMRILYVALTRARERLIVTGLCKNVEKQFEKYNREFNYFKIEDSNCFMDWIGYTICNKTNLWKTILVPYSEAITLDEDNEINNTKTNNTNIISLDDEDLYSSINSQMKWIYKYNDSIRLPNKISISELKRRSMENQENEDAVSLYKQELIVTPKFIEDNNNQGANFGTLVHETMQKLDFSKYSEDYAVSIVEKITDDSSLRGAVLKKVKEFASTELFNEIASSTRVFKEKAFNLNIKAREIYDINSEDDIMLQGIIDLYFYNKNDELILVDYKTDNVNNEQELIDRYKVQLELYKRALEEILSTKVSKTIIYSFKLEKAISLLQ